MAEWFPIVIALIFTGMLAGLLAGLLGVGGGIVIVPVLFFVFQGLKISVSSAMAIAVGTSLLTIIPTSISSIRAHYKRGNINVPLVKMWAPFIIIGSIMGSFFSTNTSGLVATAIFGLVAIIVALNMLFRTHAKPLLNQLPSKIIQTIVASIVGFVSVIMGIGGGTLGVPLLSSFNIETHKAVGTAAAFGLIIAVPGALLMLTLGATPDDAPPGTFGLANLFGFLVIVPLTTLMAPVGVRLGARINGAILKRIFAVFLIISASRMLYQSVF